MLIVWTLIKVKTCSILQKFKHLREHNYSKNIFILVINGLTPRASAFTGRSDYLFRQVFPSCRQALEEVFLCCLNLDSVSRLHDLGDERCPRQRALTPVDKAESQVLQITPTCSASKMGIPKKDRI